MASIEIKTEGDLLIVSVNGDLTAEEMITVVKEYYPLETVKNVIWDVSNGSMLSMPRNDFDEIAKVVKESVENGARQGGRTAFVKKEDLELGLVILYTIIAEMSGIPIKYHVFNSIEDARIWIELP